MTCNTTLPPPPVKEKTIGDLPDEIKASYWKILFFTKAGNAIRGKTISDSEDRAFAEGCQCEDWICNSPSDSFFHGENGVFNAREFSHFIVIPWNKK